MTTVAVIGRGTIGSVVASALAAGDVAGCTLLGTADSSTGAPQVRALVSDSDIVVEAATAAVARTLIPLALAAGTDLVACSCAALADDDILADSPRQGRIVLPPGAIGGFDILAAAARRDSDSAEVEHVTIKNSAAFGLAQQLSEPVEMFRGSAREAAKRFPLTSNSSVALAYATVGLDRLLVTVIADPSATGTRHLIRWSSSIGAYEFEFRNAVDEKSGGRTSLITAWSVIQTLDSLHKGAGPGLVFAVGAPHKGSNSR
ncbi:hypothetical protein BVC93_11990 [Mycobacterium sp. MS1601]|uniref:aspartate dehydrogenase domain-containing protein n=1 Tax=Mycobacterium sp. MS1601 TaxID=1936029 RepID=UPI0009793990|nr:aspartate dehydrogenase domain-containing protein [Mycobacterium sp. MS1601]AQA03035.1 hypothetical protein BVC93_11990 [Mycobacterium sp. MS1601]